MKRYLIYGLVIVILAAVAFAFGRYSAPTKIKTVVEVKVVEIEKQVDKYHENKDVKTVITEKPDGTKVTEIVDVSTINVETVVDRNTSTDSVSTTTKIYKRPDWQISAIAGLDINKAIDTSKVIFGGSIQRRILGPIFIGGVGFNNGTFGVSIGLEL